MIILLKDETTDKIIGCYPKEKCLEVMPWPFQRRFERREKKSRGTCGMTEICRLCLDCGCIVGVKNLSGRCVRCSARHSHKR